MIEDSLDETDVGPDLSKALEETISEIMLKNIIDKIAEGSIEMIITGVMAIIQVGIGPVKDHSQNTIAVTELEVKAIVDQGQDPEPVLIGIE